MNARIPLLDLTREYAQISSQLAEEWGATLSAMRLLKGEQVASFEREVAAYVGVPYAVGVGSGTDALLLGLLATGVDRGDRVILPANAFVAALEAVHHLGAVPVLIDSRAEDFSPDLDGLAAAFPAKAFIAVHLYGSALALDPILDLCRSHNAHLIEDASHAHGAKRNGRHVGSTGRVGCFSAGVVKNLAAYGDAGFVTTSDRSVEEHLRLLQFHGQAGKNDHVRYGYNSRLDEIQAAVLRIKLRHLDRRNARRRAIAAFYSERLAPLGVKVPVAGANEEHAYHQYVIRTPRRDELRQYLQEQGIETGIHYPVPLHRQKAWLRTYGESPPLPNCERHAAEILSLPLFPDLTDAEVERVASTTAAFFEHRPRKGTAQDGTRW
jgi:hypothetical protein